MGLHKNLRGEDIHVPSRFYIAQMQLEYVSASEIRIKEGDCASDDEDFELMRLESDLVVNIEDSGVNGLDTGSETALTWYYIYIIKNPDSGAVAGLISASLDDPTFPEGYTKKRRIGTIRNNSSSHIIPFIQFGVDRIRQTIYDSGETVLAFGSATIFTSIDCSSYLPPQSRRGYFSHGGWDSAALPGNFGIDFRETGKTPASTTSFFGYSQLSDVFWHPVSAAQEIDYKVNPATARTFVGVKGFEENV